MFVWERQTSWNQRSPYKVVFRTYRRGLGLTLISHQHKDWQLSIISTQYAFMCFHSRDTIPIPPDTNGPVRPGILSKTDRFFFRLGVNLIPHPSPLQLCLSLQALWMFAILAMLGILPGPCLSEDGGWAPTSKDSRISPCLWCKPTWLGSVRGSRDQKHYFQTIGHSSLESLNAMAQMKHEHCWYCVILSHCTRICWVTSYLGFFFQTSCWKSRKQILDPIQNYTTGNKQVNITQNESL